MLTYQTIYLASYILPSGDSLLLSAQKNISKISKLLLLGTSPQACRDEAVPGTWHSTTEIHLLLSHPFLSTTHSKRAESSSNHCFRNGEGEKRTFITFTWRLVPQNFFCETKRKWESKNLHGCYFDLTPGTHNSLCLTPFWLGRTGFPQCRRQWRS